MRFGERTENPQLVALGAQMLAQNAGVRPLDTPQMNRVLHALFEKAADLPPVQEEAFGALPDLQVFSWRKGGLYAAIQGRAQPRKPTTTTTSAASSSTRTGSRRSWIWGNCVYTAKTFGARALHADEHPRAQPQCAADRRHGAGLRAAVRRKGRARGCRSGAQMDIAGAYPAQAGVLSLERALRIGDAGITLQDTVRLSAPQQVTWVFMLREKPRLARAGFALARSRFAMTASSPRAPRRSP